MKEFLLRFVISFKADVATAIETLNSNFKTENTKLAKDIPSRMTSELTKNSKQKQKFSDELTAKFRTETDKMKEEMSKKIFNLTDLWISCSFLNNHLLTSLL
jgi:hypothetical protein